MKRQCQTCRFWEQQYNPDGPKNNSDPLENTDTAWGYCHRYPPLPERKEPFKDYHTFNIPILAPEDWCGEWQQVGTGADDDSTNVTEER